MRVYIRRIPSVDTGAEVRQGKLTLFDFRTLFLPGILIADIYIYTNLLGFLSINSLIKSIILLISNM